MPYYFYEPIFRGLMRMAVKEDYDGMNLNNLVVKIVLERLRAECVFKNATEDCPHDSWYTSKNKKVIMCEDCGSILEDEGNKERAEKNRENTKKRLVKEGKLAPEPEYAEDGHSIKPLPRGAMIVRDGEEY